MKKGREGNSKLHGSLRAQHHKYLSTGAFNNRRASDIPQEPQHKVNCDHCYKRCKTLERQRQEKTLNKRVEGFMAEVSQTTDLEEWVDLNMQGVQTIRLCTLNAADTRHS